MRRYVRISAVLPSNMLRKYKQQLIYAGKSNSPRIYVGCSLLISIILGIISFFVSFIYLELLYAVLISLFTFAVVIIVSYVLLVLAADKRAQKIEKVLPDALQLVSANIRAGMTIDKALWLCARPEFGPFEKELSFLYGPIFIADSLSEEADSRNVCIFAEGEVDRSPTGTGVSARMALHFARGEIGINEPMVIESILGTTFTGKVYETTKFGNYDAVIPEVQGTAHITGINELLIDPDDPLQKGFILR